jgi:hypothetical protein
MTGGAETGPEYDSLVLAALKDSVLWDPAPPPTRHSLQALDPPESYCDLELLS